MGDVAVHPQHAQNFGAPPTIQIIVLDEVYLEDLHISLVLYLHFIKLPQNYSFYFITSNIR